ncbi:PIG-L deacetylase family protein [Pseudoduganella danionis]|uniref:PIG-L family deacetylase n=1 Tax=Pseudoduganella danionis TaxID=1890295 RepID=A0ABW9SJC7_9BURK|nr:PIG-L family deacetylase [Pseudoduganella danionis]MTW31671.1 PIG-L family deacetylase [Pseudoduganella danionis]
MPTDSALFLFAHQDDEYGVYAAIADCVQRGLSVRCAYFTCAAGTLAAQRNAESLAVLARLGVAPQAVSFAGDTLGIADASLPQHLGAAAHWLAQWLDQAGTIDSLYVTAWEGGHHDHDALHALACSVAAQRGLLGRLKQYALYNADGCPAPWFRVLSPLPQNGPVQRSRLPWRQRWQHLRLCLMYPSQRRTWLGLFPFVLLHYLLRGQQQLQAVALERLQQRPHDGPLYYENRRFYRWEQLQQDLAQWRAQS